MLEDSLLLINIGTGAKNNKDHSDYINVLTRAIRHADVAEVVLVYSQNQTCQEIVETLKIHLNQSDKEYKVNIEKLPNWQMEFDADACYEWFDKLLKQYIDKRIIVDISHGTKAMSAALYAVGLHYNITDYQYAVKKSDGNGGFVDGAEVIKDFDASYAHWLGILKQCQTLLAARQYGAVKEIIPDRQPPKKLKNIVEKCIMLSDFCSAFDRFDYVTAKKNLVEFSIPEVNYKYDENLKAYLEYLANPIKEPDDKNGEVLSDDCLKSNIDKALNIMFDLYANGLRRLDNNQNEDAGIRAYRIAELLVQIHLMKAGYMSDHLSSSDEKVMRFADENKIRTGKNSDMYSPFSRTNQIRFLDYIHYDKAVVSYLNGIDETVRDLRNNSILIHGYTARADNTKKLAELFDSLIEQAKYFMSVEQFNGKKQTAMFLNYNFKAENHE